MLGYFKGRWPEEPIPEEEPTWFLYEVELASDRVLRSVEVYEDGRAERNSLALEQRAGAPCVSLAHGAFLKGIEDDVLAPISAEAFAEAWAGSIDKSP